MPLHWRLHCKNMLTICPSPAGMWLTKLSLSGNINYSRTGRVWSVTSRLGTGKWLTLFYSVESLLGRDTGLFGLLSQHFLLLHFRMILLILFLLFIFTGALPNLFPKSHDTLSLAWNQHCQGAISLLRKEKSQGSVPTIRQRSGPKLQNLKIPFPSTGPSLSDFIIFSSTNRLSYEFHAYSLIFDNKIFFKQSCAVRSE
jgi:hypothetical protein